MMDGTYVSILNTLISSAISLIVAFGTWHVSMKKESEKQTDEVKNLLAQHRDEYLSGIHNVQDDISQVQSNVQSQVGVIEVKIENLSKSVDKHNTVLERTFKIEEQIKSIDHRLGNLEDK